MKKLTKIITGAAVGLAALALVACTVNKSSSVTETSTGENEEMIPSEGDNTANSGETGEQNDSAPGNSSIPLTDIRLDDDRVPDDDGEKEEDDDLVCQPYYGCPEADSTYDVKEETK